MNDTLIRSEIDLLREAIPVERRMNLPTYVPSTQYRPEGWIRDAHDHGDVFVTMSRGEGFCYPVLEALAAGNLVIGGGGPAVEELGAGIGGIESMLRILPRVQVPITPMPECLGYELTQNWWETSLTDMRGALVKAAQDLKDKDWASTRRALAAEIQKMYAPERIAELIKF
jgi:glycosyltransferase involved in cell wall biosynthesis